MQCPYIKRSLIDSVVKEPDPVTDADGVTDAAILKVKVVTTLPMAPLTTASAAHIEDSKVDAR